MSVTNAYQLCLGLFKQDSTGAAYGKLQDADYAALKWNATSIIPVEYDFTNFNRGGMTVETVERNLITDLTKTTKFDSGKVTPSTLTFADMIPADVQSIVATLNALTGVDDPFKLLFCAGIYSSSTTTTRVYNVFYSTVAILTEDASLSGEAKGTFTSSLNLQATGVPLEGDTACGATMTLTTSTGAVTFATTSGSGGI